jgi:uncharacterized protein YdaU (DUF1376 family)
MFNVKNKSDASNKRGNWKHLKIVQEISEQHTEKARHQGTTENSHTERRTQTAESADVEVQNIQRGKQHYM